MGKMTRKRWGEINKMLKLGVFGGKNEKRWKMRKLSNGSRGRKEGVEKGEKMDAGDVLMRNKIYMEAHVERGKMKKKKRRNGNVKRKKTKKERKKHQIEL